MYVCTYYELVHCLEFQYVSRANSPSDLIIIYYSYIIYIIFSVIEISRPDIA